MSVILLWTLLFSGPELQGQTYERFQCLQFPDYSYALYLPPGYSPEKKWPVIFLFEPAARAAIPLNLYKPAAERYGYILVASWDSKNGPLQPQIDAVNAVWADASSRFNLDPERIYATGFSGGSRISWHMAFHASVVKGVIGCGAGTSFPDHPRKDQGFDYIGLVGDTDPNFTEMTNLERQLSDASIENRLMIFQGPHIWPSADLCTLAVEWLELRAVHRGVHKLSPVVLASMYGRRTARINYWLTEGFPHRAHEEARGVVADFKGLLDVTEVESLLAKLRDDEAVAKDKERFEKWERREVAALTEFRRKINAMRMPDYDLSAFKQDLVWWRARLDELDRIREERESEEMLKYEQRVHGFVSSGSYEEAVYYYNTKQFSRYAWICHVGLLYTPTAVGFAYNAACGYALSGNKGRALEFLEKAIDLGYNNLEHLKNDPDLASIRGRRKYKALVERLEQGTN